MHYQRDEFDDYIDQGQAYPKLSEDMITRARTYGEIHDFAAGDYLFRVGEREVSLFVILEGAVDIMESDGHGGDALVVTHERNEFTGELDQLSGRAVLVCAKAVAPTKVIRIDRAKFTLLVRSENDIGELIMRSLIMRRVGMIQNAEGGTLIVGSLNSADTLRIQGFLTRNGYPYRFLDTDLDPEAADALNHFHAESRKLPIVILDGLRVFDCPSNRQIAEQLGLHEKTDPTHVFDVVVVGAGPAGLAAAVYSASEGLDTLVIELFGPGGQAGSSSRIENYLGFPMGISGQALASRAQVQAQRFGSRLIVARAATKLDCDGFPYKVHLDDGDYVTARSIVIATGARYRRLDVPDLNRFEGRGVHYAATALEGRLCNNSEVVVIGGGNSAGQASLFLSRTAKHVHLLIRRNGLEATMSDYLIQRILDARAITVHTQCEVVGLIGQASLEAVRWRQPSIKESEQKASNLFSMIGAVPNTDWLDGCVALDKSGFVETGRQWDPNGTLSQFACSIPGVFAVGDVRSQSIKRVASSVGEGSVVVHAVHGWLARQ
ncbi:FAD-dependent oxidoreductase [Rhizobium leguminosarum]|nr:FAD-dependent oxidoreductase [Rhizobium leguminosarum]